MADRSGLREITPAEVRDRLGDGNFGGEYAKPDEQMLAIWRAGVAEAREAIEGPWT
jgi:creatinine amidohydrolase